MLLKTGGKPAPKTYCYWAEVATCKKHENTMTGFRLTLKRTPIDIISQLEPLFSDENAVILTSATLTTDRRNFTRLKTQLGIQNKQRVKEIVEPSPFPTQNLEIHLFSNLIAPPSPSAPMERQETYWKEQSALCQFYLHLHQGRALVLCRSRVQMDNLYDRLMPTLKHLNVNHYKQDIGVNVKQMIADFIDNETSVLFGLETCWEGLDAKGDTLKTLIMTRLPFTPPHPVTEARIKQLTNPKYGFSEILLPEMLLRLKQGAGRLIRSATDTGTLAILDPRTMTKSYSTAIKDVLPKGCMKRNPKEVLEYITQHS